MAADFCRLCLRPIDKAKSTDLVTETTKSAMLKEFLPEMNLDISENTQVCSSCIEELETSYNFKHGVVVNETNIQTKLEENDLKKIDLKLMLDDVAKKEVKTADYVCRTCFSICRTPSISLFDSPTNMMPYSFVKKMCQVVFELEFIAADKPVLCDDCWETLQTVYNFRKCCLRTDKKLRIFVANKNITKVNNDEFKEFAEENPPKDDAEDSSDDELDEYIKEEPVDADEIKFDPDEASCSSSSVKVKKETAVKSESELNSEDEDMEDEPELLDPKTIKSEASELDGEECKMEIGDVKVDAEGEGSAGPSGQTSTTTLYSQQQVHPFVDKLSSIGHHSMRLDNLVNDLSCVDIHQPNEIAKKFSCMHCPYKTNRNGNLKIHQLTHQLDDAVQMFSCVQCSFKTNYNNSFKRHELTHQADLKSMSSCAHYSRTTNQKGYFKKLLVIHQPDNELQMYSCGECLYKSYRKDNLKRHEMSHKLDDTVPMFPCTQCSYKTRYKQSLTKHKLSHRRKELRKQCSYKLYSSKHLKPHELSHQSNDAQRFSCAQCSYKTNLQSNLKRHELIHQPDSKMMFYCAHCSYKTDRKESLKLHLRTNQPDDAGSIFSSVQCSKRAKEKLKLTQHNQNKFYCPQCPFKTDYNNSLKRHELTHQSDLKVMLFCAHCSYKSNQKGNLITHLLTHKPDDTVQMFSCRECSYKTYHRHHLRRHELTHQPDLKAKVFVSTGGGISA